MKDTMEQHRAWKRMLEKRTCPPVDFIARGGEAVERHLKACASCRRKAGFAAAASQLSSAMPYHGPEPEELAGRAGEVRRLLRKAAGGKIYDESGWHNPPLVLLLSSVPGTEGLFLVAQIHDAPELSSEGDVPLDGDMDGCFAESWNTFKAFVDTMAPPIAVVEEKTVRLVLDASERRKFVPGHLSVLESFRNQEEAIGSFFGAFALARERRLIPCPADSKVRGESLSPWATAARRNPISKWTFAEVQKFMTRHVATFCRSEEYASRSRVSDRLSDTLSCAWSSAACASVSLPRMPKLSKPPVPFRVASFIESVAGVARKPLLRKDKGAGKNESAGAEALKGALRIGASFVVAASPEAEPVDVREVDLTFLPEGDGSTCVAWSSGIPPASYAALRVFTEAGKELPVAGFKADGGTLLLRLSCKTEDVGNSHLFILAGPA